jgi:hypothetical protein
VKDCWEGDGVASHSSRKVMGDLICEPSTHELVGELRRKLNPLLAKSQNPKIDRTGMDIRGFEEDFEKVVMAIRRMNRDSFMELKSCSLDDFIIEWSQSPFVLEGRPTPNQAIKDQEEFLRFVETTRQLGTDFIGKFKLLSLEQIAVFGVLNGFFKNNHVQRKVRDYNRSAGKAMHPHTLFRDEQCGAKDFYGDLNRPRHVTSEYFSSASVMPCSVNGHEIGILMTVADKYTKAGDWSDGDAYIRLPKIQIST